MKKLKKFFVSLFALLLFVANTVPSFVYANEVKVLHQEQQVSKNSDVQASKKMNMTESQVASLIQEKKKAYPNLTEEKMREIIYKVRTPYSSRASVWDGRGVTLDEFAFAFDVAVTWLIGGYATIGKYAAAHGVAAARAMLSRSARIAAQRIGILSNFVANLLSRAYAFINIYYNVGYSLAKFIDARDYRPNNGRINAWA
ncbi:TPA: hypothetical protein ACGPAL_000550 [Streptococcus suis]